MLCETTWWRPRRLVQSDYGQDRFGLTARQRGGQERHLAKNLEEFTQAIARVNSRAEKDFPHRELMEDSFFEEYEEESNYTGRKAAGREELLLLHGR